MEEIPRNTSLKELHEFCEQSGAGLVFVQGRRRVGKTWLLQALEAKLGERSFRILCKKHQRNTTFLREVVDRWVEWSGRSNLGNIKVSALRWEQLFQDISLFAEEYLRLNEGKRFLLIIDEIQWISTTYEQSAGILKAAWDEWAKKDSLKVILCGSSSRFFSEQFGEGSPLRGIQTRSSIKVLPFPISILKHGILKEWSIKEATLAYMCLGGIPYYWQRVPVEKGFRRAMNEACCTKSTILLEEWREIIATEFRTDAVDSLSNLFPTLMSGEHGATLSEISERIGTQPSVASRLIEKLVSYGYVTRCTPEFSEKRGLRSTSAHGARFILSDFYLHFYFSVLRPIQGEIQMNDKGLLFPYQILQGTDKAYIPTFTGKAFERFVTYHIDVGLRYSELNSSATSELTLWKKLDLPDANYDIIWNLLVRGSSSDKIISQIDTLMIHHGEQCVRVIECKWKNEGDIHDIDEVLNKILPLRFHEYSRRNFLVVSYVPSQEMRSRALQQGVTIITLDDFL